MEVLSLDLLEAPAGNKDDREAWGENWNMGSVKELPVVGQMRENVLEKMHHILWKLDGCFENYLTVTLEGSKIEVVEQHMDMLGMVKV